MRREQDEGKINMADFGGWDRVNPATQDLVLDMLPAEYDSRVKAMEVDEKPTETYTDVGGLDKQIQEVGDSVSLFWWIKG